MSLFSSDPFSSQALLAALKQVTRFEPQGDPAANLCLGRGMLDGKPLRMALVENRIASGSLGIKECAMLVPLFRVIALEKSPLILFLDSAGARVSEGLPALGAFRRMYGAALTAAISGAPIVCVLGKHCFGGASMLAHLAHARIFSPNTLLAMSGPSILAQAAGSNALDEMFRAMASAAIGTEARARTSEQNRLCQSENALQEMLCTAIVEATTPAPTQVRHDKLKERLGNALENFHGEPLQRRDLDKLFAPGYRIVEQHGVVMGEAQYNGIICDVLGYVGGKPLGALQAWQLAELAWQLTNSPSSSTSRLLMLLLDCDTHATRLDDEKLILSEYLADLSLAFTAARARGLRTTVLSKAGGGVYVAFASPAKSVAILHGAQIQVLPGSAIASILGDNATTLTDSSDFLTAGVAEEELRIGLMPQL